MKQTLLIAAIIAIAAASPAAAKPGKGQGKAHKHAYGHVEQNGHGSLYGKGLGGCPPGHAKHPGPCMPYGQWKKQFEIGQRVPLGYRGLLGYDALPYDLRSRYALDPSSRYIYQDDYLYRVDPRTMVVSQILRAIL